VKSAKNLTNEPLETNADSDNIKRASAFGYLGQIHFPVLDRPVQWTDNRIVNLPIVHSE
jgi:hypothetical protein